MLSLLLLQAFAQDLPDTPVPDDPAPFFIPDFGEPEPPAPVAPLPRPVMPVQPLPTGPASGRVFFAPIQSYEPALNAEAARLTLLLQQHMQSRGPVATIEQVPPWPDYSALVYLLGCPQGQYSGCALVCGNRVGAQFSVGGTLLRAPGGVNVNLSFVDNAGAREVLNFAVALQGNNDADLTRAVDTILGKVMEGAFSLVDLRRVDSDPREAAKLDAARKRVVAESIADMEREQGAVAREVLEVTAPEKIDKETFSRAYKEREEVKPWEAVGLKEGEYVRYKNSGLILDTWRERSRGRAGHLILRGALGAGSGPYGQYFDGRYAINDDLERAEVEQYQFVSKAAHAHVELELGLGITPWLDVTGFVAFRTSQFNYRINQERVGAVVIVDNEVRNAYSTTQFGGRLNLVPFPARMVRPAFMAGVSSWKGTSWDRKLTGIRDLEPMLPMSQILLQIGPGVEATTSRSMSIFARVIADVSLAGQRTEVFREQVDFDGGLSMKADPTTFKRSNLGFAIQGGAVFKFALSKSRSTTTQGPRQRFEEEGL